MPSGYGWRAQLEPDQRECTFLAPKGEYTLSVISRAGFLGPGPSYRWTTLGTTDVTVGDDDPTTAVIEVAAPPSTDELMRGK